jgi:hypothetical protein
MTSNSFDQNGEENYGSIRGQKNKININKNMIQLTYEVW